IHRDLKPDNIMIGRFGEVLVIDWGIAKDLNQGDSNDGDRIHKSVLSDEELNQAGMTVSGTMIGTPGYMAPEQIDGSSHRQSDVFALGLILTEVLTGTISNAGDSSIERITATASGNSRTPRDIDKSAPKELDFLASWAMELNLEDRLESADGFVDNLKAYLAGKELPDYHYSLPERLTRWTAKHPGLLISLAFGIVMISTTATLYQSVIQSEREKNQAIVVADQAKDSEARVKEAVRKIRELEVMIERGVPEEKILKGVEEALELGGDDYSLLLSAAKICRLAELDTRALELLKKASDANPAAYEALFMRHQIELKEFGGDSFAYTEAAKEIVRRADERGEANEVSLTMKANGYYYRGEFEEAKRVLRDLEKYSTKFAFGFLLRGVLKINAGDESGAMADFNKAIESDGEYALALYNRGILRKNQGDLPGALQDYDLAIRSDPLYAPAYANRGLVKAELGNAEDALKDYNKAIQVDRKYPNSYFNRAGMKKDSGDWKGALADVNEGMRWAPREAKNYFNRGYLRARLGDSPGSISDMTEAIALDEKYYDAYTLRGLYKERIGDRAGALADYDSALRINPKHAMAYFYRGAWRQRVNDNTRAFSDFNLALKYDSGYADAYYSRGLIKAGRGDRAGAVDDYSRAIKYNPKHVLALTSRGVSRYNMGDTKGSIEDYSRAIKSDPKHAKAYFNRGGSKAVLGDMKGAIADFEITLKLNPNYGKAYEMRGVIQKELKQFREAALSFESFLRLNKRAPAGARYRAFILKHLGRPSKY
ncbi:MAG: tetratricopeptide repeat protein, partial [Planctomycetota bacterium]|nr:tetratricopeptide repeat protein [Planctomycetota bacterium]